MKRIVSFFLIVVISLLTLVRCSPTQIGSVSVAAETTATVQTEQSVMDVTPIQIDGAVLIEEKCGRCHSSTRVTGAAKTMDEWTTTVDRMISHGASLSAEERQLLVDFLAATYSK